MDSDTGAVSASSVDLGAIAEDSGSYVITAAQLLAATAPANQGLFSPTSVPDLVSFDDPNSVELGVQFTASADGSISGLQFYKGPENTGPHVASLWTADGMLLATATFTDETSSGWQQVSFATPVAITAGTTYVASYHTSGNYSAGPGYFDDPLTEGPLSAPAAAGVYAYGPDTTFPDQTFNANNYWVDVVFNVPVTITALTLDSGNGTLTDNHDGTWTYTPAANDDSAASFSYTASDGTLSASSTASLDLTPVNDAPVASPVDLGAIAEDSGGHLITAAQLLAGVTDIDGPAASITALTLTSGNGTLLDNGNGTWTYTPAANDDSAASFSYTASDGTLSASSTASLDLTPVNDAPVASPVDLGAIAEDSGGHLITAAQLLAGVTDIDGPAASITALTLTSGHGTLFDNGDGTWTYTPAANDDSAASFSYTASDGALSASSTASLDLTPVNDAPVAAPVTLAAIAEDGGTRLITAGRTVGRRHRCRRPGRNHHRTEHRQRQRLAGRQCRRQLELYPGRQRRHLGDLQLHRLGRHAHRFVHRQPRHHPGK